MKRDDLLEEAFLEGPIQIQDLKLRPFSIGTLNLCRKLKLTLFTGDANASDLSDEDSLHQLTTFAWMQSAPIPEVLKHTREGTHAAQVEEFAFGLSMESLSDLTQQIARLAKQSAAAVVKVEPKPKKDGGKEEGEPPKS
jgi:hypothetical protein